MNAFVHHFAFMFRSGIRNKTLLMMNYLFPLGFYLMMGLIMAGINPFFKEVTVPAMTTFAVLAATLLGIPDPLVNAREQGIFRSYKVNGVPAFSILLIPILTTMLHLAIIATIIVTTAPLLFDAPAPTNMLNFIIVFVSMAFASSGLSVLFGVISSSSRLTVLWSQIIFLPSMMIGGLMFPLSMLPETAQKAAMLFPATHAMNAFNGLAMGTAGDFSPWGSILTLILGGLVALALAVYLFRWGSHNADKKRTPLLAGLVLLPYVAAIFLF
ncbi:MAG: ABC transporter permease [Anaerolineae bacterium]|nr:ABC transporter permease [Anaerolineae bacterium]